MASLHIIGTVKKIGKNLFFHYCSAVGLVSKTQGIAQLNIEFKMICCVEVMMMVKNHTNTWAYA